jgi:tRNA dimethylallyltransferase
VFVPVIVGPTGAGKTALATALSRLLPVEIVSADSRQVYRGLAIGTAAPSAADLAAAPHHGVGFVDPRERYSAGRFAREAAEWIAAIAARGRTPLVVGGTGFYLRALFDGLFEEPQLDPRRRARLGGWLRGLSGAEAVRWARRLDPRFGGGGAQRACRAIEIAVLAGRALSTLQAERPPATPGFRPWYAALTPDRAVLHERIARRTRAMLETGWIEEVRRLLAEGVPRDAPGLLAVGYREIVAHLDGRLTASAMEEAIVRSTRRYAKRQDTWFRHQLRGPLVRLDAAVEPAVLAQAVLAGYRAATGH